MRHVRVRCYENIKVNLTIDDTECVEVNRNGIRQFPCRDLVVLVLYICSKSDAPATRVRLTPNAESVAVRRVMRESEILLTRATHDTGYSYSSSQACRKLQTAEDAFPVEFAVWFASRDGEVPTKNVSFCFGTPEIEKLDMTGSNVVDSASRVLFAKVSYEKPTWFGWSMNSILTSLFQDHGFNWVELESFWTMQGPFSPSAEAVEDAPGPPLSQIAKGAWRGSLRDSKNQKNVFTGYDRESSGGRWT
jgi:hypothetical protein